MRVTDRQKFIVGVIVTVLLAAIVYALLRGQRSGVIEGENILIAELPANTRLLSGAPVLLEDEKVGVVDRASLLTDKNVMAVRMFVKPGVFKRVGADAWVKTQAMPSGENAIILNLGTKPSSQTFIKIKAVKGM